MSVHERKQLKRALPATQKKTGDQASPFKKFRATPRHVVVRIISKTKKEIIERHLGCFHSEYPQRIRHK
jgi:hypothetical protein